MAIKQVKTWIIGIGGSEMDDVETYRVTGTVRDVKKHLAGLVRSAKDGDPDGFEYGDTSMSKVKTPFYGDQDRLYASAVFSCHHIDYTATPEKEPIVL